MARCSRALQKNENNSCRRTENREVPGKRALANACRTFEKPNSVRQSSLELVKYYAIFVRRCIG